MLKIGGDDLAKSTIFRYWGDDLAILTRLQMSNFLPTTRVGVVINLVTATTVSIFVLAGSTFSASCVVPYPLLCCSLSSKFLTSQ